MLGPLFEGSDVVLPGRRKGLILHLAKGEQNKRVFVASPKTVAGVEHLQRMCKDALRVAGAVQRHVHQRCSEVRAVIS